MYLAGWGSQKGRRRGAIASFGTETEAGRAGDACVWVGSRGHQKSKKCEFNALERVRARQNNTKTMGMRLLHSSQILTSLGKPIEPRKEDTNENRELGQLHTHASFPSGLSTNAI